MSAKYNQFVLAFDRIQAFYMTTNKAYTLLQGNF